MGSVVDIVLVAELPEPGRFNEREMAALAGVAPEPRPVPRLGRSCLRVHDSLHGHVTATRHSPAVHAFHVRLCCRGKLRKVTLIAAMRKLLLVLNTVPRDQIPWQPNCVPTAGED